MEDIQPDQITGEPEVVLSKEACCSYCPRQGLESALQAHQRVMAAAAFYIGY
jgi:hypothetical protein